MSMPYKARRFSAMPLLHLPFTTLPELNNAVSAHAMTVPLMALLCLHLTLPSPSSLRFAAAIYVCSSPMLCFSARCLCIACRSFAVAIHSFFRYAAAVQSTPSVRRCRSDVLFADDLVTETSIPGIPPLIHPVQASVLQPLDHDLVVRVRYKTPERRRRAFRNHLGCC